jgi:hypothetical protein
MNFASEKIKSTRIEQDITLDIVSYETGLKKDFIQWIEEAKFENFDSLALVTRYVKIYADYLGLNGVNLSKIVERDIKMTFAKPSKKVIVQNYSAKKVNTSFKLIKYITPQTLKLLISSIVVISIGIFFIYSFINTTNAPIPYISDPYDISLESDQTINLSEQKISFKGYVIGIGELRVNNKVVPQQPGGFFETETINLSQAENLFVFETRNLYGKKNRSVLTILRQDLISLRDEQKYISVIAGEQARFVLIRIDNEIVYNDTVIPNQILGFDIKKSLRIETSQFKEFKIRYLGNEYVLTAPIQSFEISDNGLILL